MQGEFQQKYYVTLEIDNLINIIKNTDTNQLKNLNYNCDLIRRIESIGKLQDLCNWDQFNQLNYGVLNLLNHIKSMKDASYIKMVYYKFLVLSIESFLSRIGGKLNSSNFNNSKLIDLINIIRSNLMKIKSLLTYYEIQHGVKIPILTSDMFKLLLRKNKI